MNERLRAYLDQQAQATDDDVRQAIALANGDVVQALRITLIANAFLVEENARLRSQLSSQVSAGFARRRPHSKPKEA